MPRYYKVLIAFVASILIVLGASQLLSRTKTNGSQMKTPALTSSASPKSQASLADPIPGGRDRVTKKPFGLYVSPKNSPISPEKFTGYHTGTDFETSVDEQNADVPIYAVCNGPLLEKTTATGYGGVMVQSCTLDGQAVTIIYGHIKLTSVTVQPGQELQRSEKIAILGKGFSSETDGERKHLHLGIHKGSSINIKGYVSQKSDLSEWLNALDYLK